MGKRKSTFIPYVGYRGTPMERFMRKVQKTDSCWWWTATKDKLGYGRFSFGPGNDTTANRAAYILFKGPIPANLDTDHLCRNPSCVNPAHIEAVTHRENVLRGEAPTAYNFQRKVCRRGHPLTTKNTYMDSGKQGRYCKTCKNFQRRLEKIKYPGQEYFHRNNINIRRAENNFCNKGQALQFLKENL